MTWLPRLGIDSGISKSEVSRICGGLDEVVTAFRTRRLDHTEFSYVYLDATYLHVRMGLDVGDSEDEVFWRGFLAALKRRGLTGVRLVIISDQHAGLVVARKRSFQGTAHQRCRVHLPATLLAHVPKTHTDMVAAVFRTIFAKPTPPPSPRPGTRCATTRPRRTCWRSPRSPDRTGQRSGAPTRSSG